MRQEVIQKAPERAKKQTPNLTGIPTQMKLDFERRSGLSFDDVRVHYNSDKPRKIGALAYTQIPQVHIGPGQERHLRHELGHVVQQKQGIVRPTTWINGLPVNDSPGLEHDADRISSKGISQTINHHVDLNGNPLQFYREESKEGVLGKISKNGQFFLADNGTLYAKPAKIREANTVLERGGLSCWEGDLLCDSLKEVVIVETTDLLREEKRLSLQFATELLNILRSTDYAATPIEDLENIKLEIFGEENVEFENLVQDDRDVLMRYLVGLQNLANRPFLESDCKKLAARFTDNDRDEEIMCAPEGLLHNVGDYVYALPLQGQRSARYNYHYATVIMTDNTDYITIESCATSLRDMYTRSKHRSRSGSSDVDLFKFEYDPFWSFNIYGRDKQDFSTASKALMQCPIIVFSGDASLSDVVLIRSLFRDRSPLYLLPEDGPSLVSCMEDSSSRVDPSEKTGAPIRITIKLNTGDDDTGEPASKRHRPDSSP